MKFGEKVRVLDLELGFGNWEFVDCVCVWAEEEFEVFRRRREGSEILRILEDLKLVTLCYLGKS